MTKKKAVAKPKPAAKKKGGSNLNYANPKKKVVAKKVAVKRTPRQASLPTMEDRAIERLESQARDIKDIEGQMSELRKEKVVATDALIASMKEFGRTTYHHDGVTINLQDQTKAKVKVKPSAEEDDAEGFTVDVNEPETVGTPF